MVGKSVRERVAERQRQAAKFGERPMSPVEMAEAEKKRKSLKVWDWLSTAGMAVQLIAAVLIIYEAYSLWSGQSGRTHWQWIGTYAVIFVGGRIVRLVADMQRKSIRRSRLR
jgi:hypothetical protein